MADFFFNALLGAAAAVNVKPEPIYGSTGVWVVNVATSETTVISSGMTLTLTEPVGSGRVASRVYVYSGGLAIDPDARYWGYLYISAGGTAISGTVNGGNAFIAAGGTALDTRLAANKLYVRGGVACNTVVSGGSLTIESRGSASGVVLRGGSLIVSSGCTALGVVSSGGTVVSAAGAVVEYA